MMIDFEHQGDGLGVDAVRQHLERTGIGTLRTHNPSTVYVMIEVAHGVSDDDAKRAMQKIDYYPTTL